MSRAASGIPESTLVIKTLIPGDAVHFPRSGDTCLVNYVGYLSDGTMFDNSYVRDRPLCFILGERQVIAGWEEGIYNIILSNA
jgi:FK506-binding protein 1